MSACSVTNGGCSCACATVYCCYTQDGVAVGCCITNGGVAINIKLTGGVGVTGSGCNGKVCTANGEVCTGDIESVGCVNVAGKGYLAIIRTLR